MDLRMKLMKYLKKFSQKKIKQISKLSLVKVKDYIHFYMETIYYTINYIKRKKKNKMIIMINMKQLKKKKKKI